MSYIRGLDCWHEVQPNDEHTLQNRQFIGTKCGTSVIASSTQKELLDENDTLCQHCVSSTPESRAKVIKQLRKFAVK